MKRGIFFKGDVKDVFKEIAEARGWTVEQLIKLYRLEEVEREQLREIVEKAERRQTK